VNEKKASSSASLLIRIQGGCWDGCLLVSARRSGDVVRVLARELGNDGING